MLTTLPAVAVPSTAIRPGAGRVSVFEDRESKGARRQGVPGWPDP